MKGFRNICSFVLCCILLSAPSPVVNAQSYLFGSLTGLSDFMLWTPVGDAIPGDTPGDPDALPDEVLLTQNGGNSIGAVYFSSPIDFAQCTGWRVEFQFRIFDSSNPYSLFGDGLAFWVTPNPPASFSSGTDLGIGGAMQGLKVCFDTWDAGCNGANPEIQIRNGVGYAECWAQPTLHNTAGSLDFIRSNTYNNAVISYNAGNISVTVNGTTYLTAFSPVAFTSGYFGFSASTGAAWDRHSIKNIYIYTEQVPSNAGSDVTYCSGSTTTIGGASTPGYTYSWSPSTGLSSTTVSNPTVSLVNNTTAPITQQYIVSTLLSTSGSCPTYDTVVVTVNPMPQSSFTLSDDTICEGTNVIVQSNNPVITGMTYDWDFDGATIASGSGPGPYNLTWNGQNAHTISFTTIANGCTSVVQMDTVQVWQIPTADFSISDSTLCQFDSTIVTYTGNASAAANYNWNFGTGTLISGSGQGPIEIDYNTTGNSSLSLYVVENGCSSSVQDVSISVSPRPVADFSISAAQGCTDLGYDVTYTGSSHTGATYNWNFYGATVNSGTNAGPYNLSFPNQGWYFIDLEVDLNGCTSQVYNDSIEIFTTPTSGFIVSDTGACEDDPITITYVGNAGTGANYSWDFDGANLNSGSGQGPYLIDWPTGGNPSISLTVTENGCSSTQFVQQIIITAKPTSQFTVDNILCELEQTTVTHTGTAGPTASFNWNFNGALIGSGSNQGPYNVWFPTPGNYTMELYVDDNGCQSDTSTVNITVHPKPDASFAGTNLVGCEPLTSSFSANVQDAANSYAWDFEALTGTGFSPTVTFNAGQYDVELVVTTPEGCKDTASNAGFVEAYLSPISDFTVNNTQLSGSNPTLSISDASSFADSYFYSFGNGAVSLEPNPSHTYNTEGEWLVTQVVSTNNGCVDSSSQVVYFAPSPLIFIPNSFTPNLDNHNNTWKISMSYITKFELTVFNRWGEVIFQSNDIFDQWDGFSKRTSQKAPTGVYAYRILYTDLSGLTKDIVGSVHLIR